MHLIRRTFHRNCAHIGPGDIGKCCSRVGSTGFSFDVLIRYERIFKTAIERTAGSGSRLTCSHRLISHGQDLRSKCTFCLMSHVRVRDRRPVSGLHRWGFRRSDDSDCREDLGTVLLVFRVVVAPRTLQDEKYVGSPIA